MSNRTPIHPDAARSLMLAVIASSTAPVLLIDEDLSIVAASSSFCSAFALHAEEVVGRDLAGLGNGEWGSTALGSLIKATLSGYADVEAYEMKLTRPGLDDRRLVLNARKLDYADDSSAYLLLTVADVTEALIAEKLKSDLLREKEILLRELQHRVANSLQIIASVLMQSARNVKSKETRRHLADAHDRVMSIAALQSQLAVSRLGDVELRTYFKALCDSISASMIRDHNQISLQVSADDSMATADVSVSLGLIVTELVINALKHAFPGARKGQITVDYRSTGPAWALSVSDDGIGIRRTDPPAKPGLGTSIVDALAMQLDAKVAVTDANPGTLVSVFGA